MEWAKSLGLIRVVLDDHVADPEENGSTEGFTLMTGLIKDVSIAIELGRGCDSLVDVVLSRMGQTT